MSRGRPNRGAYAALLLLVAMHVALALLWPEEGVAGFRLWALTPLRAAPPGVTWAIVAFAILTGVGSLARSGSRNEEDGTAPRSWRSGLPSIGSNRAVWIVALLTALGLCTTFSVRYGFLGDNWLRVNEALHGSGNPNERGAIAFFSTLVRLLGDGTTEGAAEAFRTIGLVSGLAYALVWLGLVSRRGVTPAARGLFVTLALFSGVFLLFCGYLEIYAPLLVALLLVAFITVLAARRRYLVFLPPVFALSAAAFHLVALLWVPMSLVPLLARTIGRRRGRVVGSTVLAIALGLGLALFLSRESSLFLRLAPIPDRPYALFSLPHLSDYLNAQWVGSTAGVVIGWSGLLVALRRPEIPTVTWIAIWGWLLPAIGLFLFNPVLGAADWDVLSLAAPFGLLVGLSAWEGSEEGASGGSGGPGGAGRSSVPMPLLPIALALNVLVTPAWFLLHRSEASVHWIGRIVRSDSGDYYQNHPADLHLAFLYGSNGLPAERIRALETGRSIHPEDPRFPLGLARSAAAEERWPDAEALAMEAYGIVRGYLPALDVLYDVFRATGRTVDQRGVGDLLLQAAASDPAGTAQYLPRTRLEEIERDLRELADPLSSGD